jgi:hypothetical protein
LIELPLGRRVATGTSAIQIVSSINAPLLEYSPSKCPASSYINKVVPPGPDFSIMRPLWLKVKESLA